MGYGAQSVTIDHGPSFHYADVRYVATGGLLAVNPSWLRISMNPARGDGGTCYGDSGGPNFLGAGATETNIVAAITITGDFMCRATNVDYRVDTASARAFLGQYVTLPWVNDWVNDATVSTPSAEQVLLQPVTPVRPVALPW